MKAFSLSEWVVKGTLIFIGFSTSYITFIFIVSSVLYWAMTKNYLMYDTMVTILRYLTIL